MSKQNEVDEEEFFTKVRKNLGRIPFAADVVALYFCFVDDATPTWAKVQIAGALAYFISPIDAIPDVLVPLGYTDDAGVIATCVSLLGAHVTADHKRKAKEWFN